MFPKRGAVALVTTALALILLISFKTPDQVAPTTATTGDDSASVGSTGSTSGSTTTTSGGSGATTTPAPTTGTARSGTETITGSLVSTRYGPVEVRITVTDGQITDIVAVELPTGGRSGQISNYVEPILASEALRAQNANIDIVSGATYTSEAYARSLQSALDQAGIATIEVAA